MLWPESAGAVHVPSLLALPSCCVPAEWVPVGRLLDAGLINACGFMLNTTEFRDAACDVMRQVAGAQHLGAGVAGLAGCRSCCSLYCTKRLVGLRRRGPRQAVRGCGLLVRHCIA